MARYFIHVTDKRNKIWRKWQNVMIRIMKICLQLKKKTNMTRAQGSLPTNFRLLVLFLWCLFSFKKSDSQSGRNESIFKFWRKTAKLRSILRTQLIHAWIKDGSTFKKAIEMNFTVILGVLIENKNFFFLLQSQSSSFKQDVQW